MLSGKGSMRNIAYDNIKQKIIFNELNPGSKLVESELMSELKIGRTPIREAMIQLKTQGLIEVIPQSGSYVAKINLEAAEDARFVRENIEKTVSRDATVKDDGELAIQLRELISIAKIKFESSDPKAFFQFDNSFHRMFYKVDGRENVWGWMQDINAQLERFRWLRLTVSGLSWETIIEQHEDILEAVESNDAGLVESLISSHLKLMLKEKSDLISAYPDFFINE